MVSGSEWTNLSREKSSQPIRVEYDFKQMMADGARFCTKGSLTRSWNSYSTIVAWIVIGIKKRRDSSIEEQSKNLREKKSKNRLRV